MAMRDIGPDELFKRDPPPFGRPMLDYFPLDPEYINLNHGSYGLAPYIVHKVAQDLSFKLEANPDRFLRLECLNHLNDVRQRLANLVKVDRDEIVLVPNTSVGVNTVLRNFEWEKDDVIICFNTTYNSVYQTACNLGDIPPYPTVSEIKLGFPTTPHQIITQFRDHIKSLALQRKDTPNKSTKSPKCVAIVDSIGSNPGVYLPWKEMVKICKEEGIWSVVDAAHSIGQEQDIDLRSVEPDFWVSNCHKWLHCKKSVAMLYIPERNRDIIKTSLPTSHAYRPVKDRSLQDFLAQFEWNGTIDFIPYLTVGTALDFRAWIGGEAKIFEYCHNLAIEGGKRMAEILGTRVMDPNGEFTLNMVNVELPLPGRILWSSQVKTMLDEKMLNQRNAYSAHFYHNGKWWTRCSAQIYNEVEDFEKLAKIWIEVCDEVTREVDEGKGKP
ncbi:hypothetical protein AGABI1DRAFT_105046 [Agaricus bisporus var. burnettii JB137-S8]|uniref:Aminotransferase class V domain-containing protein n=1 Tax=Agaricus bisporus var. burnettii (strain JB137-S8 / ATCC MYA-4627 / FGSC 10392) TaxID=597362 RepID=K5X0Y2_AGABU|nr:uncharacterized protein AGABI1DRAFT_105046 [Agaricus bisporus var. burnettii JB137-S8]EKM81466.1 hypothetical protein AGABI1DRAFT_105046 [Agaricus bisporus var. burnettii JB137-S8]